MKKIFIIRVRVWGVNDLNKYELLEEYGVGKFVDNFQEYEDKEIKRLFDKYFDKYQKENKQLKKIELDIARRYESTKSK